jgi:hypothetical protein
MALLGEGEGERVVLLLEELLHDFVSLRKRDKIENEMGRACSAYG